TPRAATAAAERGEAINGIAQRESRFPNRVCGIRLAHLRYARRVVSLALPPPNPTAVVAMAPGPRASSVGLTGHTRDAWLRYSLPASADVAVAALPPARQGRIWFSPPPRACPTAAGRRICTFRLPADARGHWRIELRKRSAAAAVVRVSLLELRITVPPPR